MTGLNELLNAVPADYSRLPARRNLLQTSRTSARRPVIARCHAALPYIALQAARAVNAIFLLALTVGALLILFKPHSGALRLSSASCAQADS